MAFQYDFVGIIDVYLLHYFPYHFLHVYKTDKLFYFQIQHIVYQIQYLFLEESKVRGDNMEDDFIPASSMHFSQVASEASMFLDSIAAEVHQHGY